LQVEHPVTELVTGVDLVREMVRVAAGEPLAVGTPELRGAAIEARIYAEDPARGFVPSPGKVERLTVPGGPFVRDDSGIFEGAEVSSHYDPLLAKLSVWAPTRAEAVARMTRALGEYRVDGLTTNLAFLERLVASSEFAAAAYDTGFVERHAKALNEPDSSLDHVIAAAAAAVASDSAAARGTAGRDAATNGDALTPWVAAHRARLFGH
jgi:acetyl-CoA carboxylase, biotin carboxylase subunit